MLPARSDARLSPNKSRPSKIGSTTEYVHIYVHMVSLINLVPKSNGVKEVAVPRQGWHGGTYRIKLVLSPAVRMRSDPYISVRRTRPVGLPRGGPKTPTPPKRVSA